LALTLLVALLQLHLRTGYPKQWDAVQVGMTISQVRSICGPPRYNNAGMKPDLWQAPFLFGRWQLDVSHAEIEQGPQAVTTTKEITYRLNGSQYPLLVLHRTLPPVQDWEAYYRAFGQAYKPVPLPPRRE